jgi:hypothetical protein
MADSNSRCRYRVLQAWKAQQWTCYAPLLMADRFLAVCLCLHVLSSCGTDTRSLGDRFVVYRDQATMEFTAVGLELPYGGMQGLIDGKIVRYGSDDQYVVVELLGNEFHYFRKRDVLTHFEGSGGSVGETPKAIPIVGPIDSKTYLTAVQKLGLPLCDQQLTR